MMRVGGRRRVPKLRVEVQGKVRSPALLQDGVRHGALPWDLGGQRESSKGDTAGPHSSRRTLLYRVQLMTGMWFVLIVVTKDTNSGIVL